MQKNELTIFEEVINFEVNNLGFINPQYEGEYCKLYWLLFWDLFEKKFSDKFLFKKPENFKYRTFYLKAKNKSNNQDTLFVLSLAEGDINSFKHKVRGRLRFGNAKFKEYLKQNKSIFFILFYAPLKSKFERQNLHNFVADVINNTDFDNTICIIATLQRIWNCSVPCGKRYYSIINNQKYYKQDEISIGLNFDKIVKVLKDQDFLQNNNIFFKNNIPFNENPEGVILRKKNVYKYC